MITEIINRTNSIEYHRKAIFKIKSRTILQKSQIEILKPFMKLNF